MKDDINLLPLSVLAQRRRRIVFVRAGHILRRVYFILFLLLAVQGSLYAAFLYIDTAILLPAMSHVESSDTLEKEVRALNARIRLVHEEALGREEWTANVATVLNAVPPAIRISSLSVQKVENSLVVRGTTVSRIAVIDFHNELKKLPWVERVEAPLQNLAVVPAGEFTFTLIPRKPTVHAGL